MATPLKYALADAADSDGRDWRNWAACRDEDPELFYAVGDSGPALLQIAEAKAVCRRCPVVSDCLAEALVDGADAGFGVWGGTSEKERRALRRRGAPPAEVTPIHAPVVEDGDEDTKPERKSA